MHRLANFGLIILLSLIIAVIPVRAQEGIFDSTAVARFGEAIHFQAILKTTQPLKYALLYFQEHGNTRTEVKPVNISILDNGVYQMDFLLDLTEQPMRVFSTLEYRFEVTLQNGDVISSPSQSLDYVDDRFPWQEKQEASYRVHWYQGDLTFAQKALDAAQSGQERIRSILPVNNPPPIDIYIYPNSSDMQETLQLAGQTWVAGHAEPDLSVIVVTLPAGPEQQLLMEQRIPHELLHVWLYNILGDNYTNLPTWLSEGLASNAELLPNLDYQIALENAYAKEKLTPMASLCNNFPRDASGALLAYAQSTSFVSFIRQSYGSERLHDLLNEYVGGVSCDIGVQNALGVSLAQLERQWRRAQFGENQVALAMAKLWPWLILASAAILIPLILGIIWLRSREKPKFENQVE